MKKCIHSNTLPPAVGPYSVAVRAGDFIFLSGQIPYSKKNNAIIHATIAEETFSILNNIRFFLEEQELDLSCIIKTTVYLVDLSLFDQVNRIYQEFFHQNPPARSCIEVSRLPKDVQIEIECIIYDPCK